MEPLWNVLSNEFHVVDVFAEKTFAGNPLAVVIHPGELSDEEMLAIAREMNYSETTFIQPTTEKEGEYSVRIFTLARELPFAGHPIIGTAWVIRHRLAAAMPNGLRLNLPIGPIHVEFEDSGDDREIVWFRSPAVEPGPPCPREEIAAALQLEPNDLDPRTPVQQYSAGVSVIIVPVKTLDALRRCRLSTEAFIPLRGMGFQPMVYAFCPETYHPGNDFCARFFFEALGVREDPAAGNATAFFGAYLLEHGSRNFANRLLRIEQGYEMARPSLLLLRARKVRGAPEIRVGGWVVQSAIGHLC